MRKRESVSHSQTFLPFRIEAKLSEAVRNPGLEDTVSLSSSVIRPNNQWIGQKARSADIRVGVRVTKCIKGKRILSSTISIPNHAVTTIPSSSDTDGSNSWCLLRVTSCFLHSHCTATSNDKPAILEAAEKDINLHSKGFGFESLHTRQQQ
jgi:hypothetical protein